MDGEGAAKPDRLARLLRRAGPPVEDRAALRLPRQLVEHGARRLVRGDGHDAAALPRDRERAAERDELLVARDPGGGIEPDLADDPRRRDQLLKAPAAEGPHRARPARVAADAPHDARIGAG